MTEHRSNGMTVRVTDDPVFDYFCCLRVLWHPSAYPNRAPWSDQVLRGLSPRVRELGAFFFGGAGSCLAFGLLPWLAHRPATLSLHTAAAQLEPSELLVRLLNNGESPLPSVAKMTQLIVDGHLSWSTIHPLVTGQADLEARMQRAVESPKKTLTDFIELLRELEAELGQPHELISTPTISRASQMADGMVDMLPLDATLTALTGGYALGNDLDLSLVTLAPATFISPFMASRIDPVAREAVVVFRVENSQGHGPGLEELAQQLRALANPHRLRILQLLAEQDLQAPQLLEDLGLSQPTVHHHLAQLRSAGFIRQDRHQAGVTYSLRRGGLTLAAAQVHALAAPTYIDKTSGSTPLDPDLTQP